MKKKIPETYLREIVVSVILVTQDDDGEIKNILEKIKNILATHYPNFEIIVIDNNSDDLTLVTMRELYKTIPHLRIIELAKRYTLDIAYTAGLDNCIGDYAILFNFHVTKPEAIPQFVEVLFQGYQSVSLRPQKGIFTTWSINGFLLLFLEKLSRNKFVYEPLFLVAFTRKIINNITKIRRKNRNFLYVSNAMGFKKIIVKSSTLFLKKQKGTNFNFFSFLLLVSDILITNSFKPLRLLVILGILVSLLFLIVSVLFLILPIKISNVFVILLGAMFFFLFSLLAIIAEYLIRILEETRNEPLYFIEDEIDQSVVIKNRKRKNII